MKKIVRMGLFCVTILGSGMMPALAQEFGPAEATEIYYWVSNKSNLPLFVQYDYVGMEKVANELGIKVRVAGPTDFDLPGYIAAVEQVCAQKPAGVAVMGGWDPSVSESVNKCMEQGVPTVVQDGDLPLANRLAYIGTNWTTVGRAKAKAMIEALPDGGKLATMSIINSDSMRLAVSAFTEYVEENGGGKYEFVANEDDNGDAAKAAEATASVLAAHPDIAGIAGFDSESGAGIVLALREAGKQPGEIKVTATEQSSDFFKTLKEGWVLAIVAQNRELFTYYSFKLLYDYNHNGLETVGLDAAAGGVTIPPVTDTGVLVVTAANVDGVLKAAGIE